MTEPFTIQLLMPEIALVIVTAWIFIGGTLARGRFAWPTFAAMSFFVAAAGLFFQLRWEVMRDVFEGSVFQTGPLALDILAYGTRWLAVACGFLLCLTAARGGGKRLSSEYQGTLVLSIVGVMLVASSLDLVLMFAALELISIPTYILLFLGRADRSSGEATAKYFFLSILSSAMFLYGIALLYGVTGSTELPEIAAQLRAAGAGEGATGIAGLAPLALVLITVGLAFRITAVPMHFYAPDVYQGTTAANAALLAVLPKIAGIVAITRIVAASMPGLEGYGWKLILAIALLTMTIGNLSALMQNNVRRMLAYSSIAHGGYMLIGLAVSLALAENGVPGGDALAAMLFYVVVYAAATLGTFAALAYLSPADHEVNHVDELAGLVGRHPFAAAALGIFMFSLTGLPPLAGFWGKLTLFGSAIVSAWEVSDETTAGWFIALAVVGVLNAAISAGYYLRIVGAMYFRSPVGELRVAGPRSALAAALICAVLVLGLGVLPRPVLDAARGAGAGALPGTSARLNITTELPATAAAPQAAGKLAEK